jgi:ABC-type branched-subunit amino acid transport system substrate-binding protein
VQPRLRLVAGFVGAHGIFGNAREDLERGPRRARGPPACDAMLVGTSLSLSGRFRRQGEQARDGLQLWVEYARDAGQRPVPRLIVLDDESRASVAQAHARRLLAEHQVDVLLGPYSSGLVRAVAPIADGAGKVLWNHGGTSDAILQAGARRVVSVASPASDYLRSLPAWGRRRVPVVNRVTVLHAASGTFASEVARGAAEGARAAGCVDVRVVPFESPLLDASALCRKAALWDPDLVVSVGTFEDDLAVARERTALPERTVLGLVAAGLAAFGDELGALAEGIIGPSQWEPADDDTPLLGPDSDSFIAAFEEAFHRPSEYPAAQAFAIGLILMECRRRCGESVDDAALLGAARALETTTFYGGFRLDPVTGKQVGHRIRLVRWQEGRKRVVD